MLHLFRSLVLIITKTEGINCFEKLSVEGIRSPHPGKLGTSVLLKHLNKRLLVNGACICLDSRSNESTSWFKPFKKKKRENPRKMSTDNPFRSENRRSPNPVSHFSP
jgi:hypothetical protein